MSESKSLDQLRKNSSTERQSSEMAEVVSLNPIKKIEDKLNSDFIINMVANRFPKHLRGEGAKELARQWIGTICGDIRTKSGFKDCTIDSIIGSLLTCAQLGLEPGPLGLVYLQTYWNDNLQSREMSVTPGYRGYLEMIRRSGQVNDIDAVIVYEKDEFSLVKRSVVSAGRLMYINELHHKPYLDGEDRGKKIMVYATANLRGGDAHMERMTAFEIALLKSNSKSRDRNGKLFGPWVNHEEEMWRKSIIRRLYKYVASSSSVRVMEALDTISDLGESQNLGAIANGQNIESTLFDIESKVYGKINESAVVEE